MGRSIAKAVWADGTERYFVHCNTSAASFSRLFASAAEALEAYNSEGLKALKSVRAATDLEVVKIAIGHGWQIEGIEELAFGLATGDQLVYCSKDDFGREDPYSVQDLAGVLHIAKFVDGGWAGHYNAALCSDGEYKEAVHDMPLAALFGRSSLMCSTCRMKVLGLTTPPSQPALKLMRERWLMKDCANDEDRKHFCSREQALAAIPDELPFRSNGHRHVAVNLSTGHSIPCADAYMAAGYVAGSAVLFPQWRFALQMGPEQVAAFGAHPNFESRLKDERWGETEQAQRESAAYSVRLRAKAQAAYDAVIAAGVVDDDEP